MDFWVKIWQKILCISVWVPFRFRNTESTAKFWCFHHPFSNCIHATETMRERGMESNRLLPVHCTTLTSVSGHSGLRLADSWQHTTRGVVLITTTDRQKNSPLLQATKANRFEVSVARSVWITWQLPAVSDWQKNLMFCTQAKYWKRGKLNGDKCMALMAHDVM